MKRSFVVLPLILCLGALAFGEAPGSETLRRIDGHIDTILNLAQAYPGQVRADLMNSALEIRRLLSTSSDQADLPKVLKDQDLVGLLATLKSSKSYQDQRAAFLPVVRVAKVTVVQVKRIVACVVDVANKREALGLLFPSVVDPENVDQLFDVYAVATPPSEPVVYKDAEVDDLVARVRAAWPYNGQKILLQNLPATPKFTVAQVKRVVAVIDFDKNKREVLSMLLPGVTDPEKVDLLFDVFWTAADKEFLASLVKKKS